MRVVADASVVSRCLVTEDDSEALLVTTNHDVAAPDFLLIECEMRCRGRADVICCAVQSFVLVRSCPQWPAT